MSTILCSGGFEFVLSVDDSLQEPGRIETPGTKAVGVIKIPSEDPSIQMIAVPSRHTKVTGAYSDYPILIFENEELVTRCEGHRIEVYGLTSFSSPTRSGSPIIVSGGNGDRRVKVFDVSNGSELAQFPRCPEYTYGVVHAAEWTNEVFVVGDGLFQYDVAKLSLIHEVPNLHKNTVFGVAVSVSEDCLITVSADETVRVTSHKTLSCEAVMRLSKGSYSVYYAEDLHLVFAGLGNGEIDVWDLRRTDCHLRQIQTSSELVFDIDRVDEKRFVSVSFDPNLWLWDHSSTRIVRERMLEGKGSGVCVLVDDVDGGAATFEERSAFLFELSSFLVVIEVSGVSLQCWQWLVKSQMAV